MSASELAQTLSVDERGLDMLLHALAALELLEKSGDRFQATPLSSSYLSKKSDTYMGYIIMHHANLVESWSRLDDAVKTGAPVRRRVSHDANSGELKSFLMGMYNLASLLAPQITAGIDLSDRTRLLDLGGGPGTYAIHFCLRNPDLIATVFDLATTRPFAEQTVNSFNLSDRISFAAGDITRDDIGAGYDVIWISHLLHSEGPESCAAIIAKAARALIDGGRLLIQEFILDETKTAPLFPALFSLNMLVGTPAGRAYSQSELGAMMANAGFVSIERLPLELPNGAGIMSGVARQTHKL